MMLSSSDVSRSTPTSDQILGENDRVHRLEAANYDRLHGEIFNGFEQRRIERDLDRITSFVDGEALDLGAGTGNLTLKLLDRGFQVTAVDLSEPLLTILDEKAPHGGDTVHLIREPADDFLARIQELPRLVVMSSFLHHLPDPWETLGAIASKLPAGGLVYITHEPTDASRRDRVPGFRTIDRMAWNLIHPKLSALARTIDYSVSDFHAREGFNPVRIQEYLQARGVETIDIETTGWSKFGALAWLADRLGAEDTFTIIAQKREAE